LVRNRGRSWRANEPVGGAMGADVIELMSQEDAVLDTGRLLVLRQSLGDQRCREVVEEVVFHLTNRISLLQKALTKGDRPAAQALALRLASLSEQVGLTDFARVARDVAGRIDADDAVALAAVAGRLIRLSEESLFSVMLYADQSAL